MGRQRFPLLVAVLAARIALLWQAKAKPSFCNDVAKELYLFLLNASGSAYEVRAFEQLFIGDLEDVEDFVPQVVLDYSEDLFSLAANARAFASKSLFLYSNDDLRVPQPQAKPLRENKADVWSTLASSLARHFGWEEAILLIDWPNKSSVLDTFEEPFTEQLTVGEGLEQGVYDLLATREIRRSGVHAVFLMTSAAITAGMLRAFTKYTMDRGYAFVLLGSHQFDVSLYPTGVLSLALAGSEHAKSPVEVDFWYLLYALTSRPLDQWSIVNAVQGKQYTVGIFDKNNLTISPHLYFPRGLPSPPQNEPFPLFFNLNTWDESGSINLQRASLPALEDLKLFTRRFEIVPLKISSCRGYNITDPYVSCYMASRTLQSILLYSSDSFEVSINQNVFMQSTSLLMPFISSASIAYNLTSRVEFPNFIRLMQDTNLINPHFGLIARKLMYDKYIVFFQPLFGEATLQSILDFSDKTGIEIVNRDTLLQIDYADPDYFTKAGKLIKDSQQRPVMIVASNVDFFSFTKAFDEVGLKDEDMVIVGLFLNYFDMIPEGTLEQIAVLSKYSKSYLFSHYTTYIGDKGQKVKDRMEKEFRQETSQDCFTYDGVDLVVRALDFMIKRGLDFNSWEDVIFAVRNTRFVGCTGIISFSEDDNNRSSLDSDWSQFRETDGEVKQVKVLKTSISGQSYYKYNDFEWYGSTSATPKQNRLNEVDCPFPEEYRQDSDQSTDLTIALNWAVVGLCVVMNVATYFAYVRGSPFLDNEEAITLSTQDNIVLASTLIEPLVFDLVSPGLNVFTLIMGNSIDLWLDWSDGKYFSLLSWIYALTGAALVTSVTCAFNKFKPFFIDFQLLAAFIVRSLFFVLAFILLSTLDCNESQAAGDLELSDAFMDVDCYQQCWTESHKKHAIASVVFLAGLVVLCSTLSSRLTNSLEGLQVYVNPTTELVRKSFLLILIALYKSRPRLSTAAHYALYLVALAVYSAVCIRLRVLSISLLSSCFNTLLLLLLLMNFCEVLASEVYSNTVMWICFGVGLGLTLIGLMLLKIRKFPKLLITAPKIDTEALFGFAFRRNQAFPANRFMPVAGSQRDRAS